MTTAHKSTKKAAKSARPKAHAKPHAKAHIEAHTDAPAPKKGKAVKTAKEILKAASPGVVETKKDTLEPQLRRAAEILKDLRKENFEFHHAKTKEMGFDASAFAEFFQAEIDAEVAKPANVVNDRFARWRCQCCDVVIPVPRRTSVLHGDYFLEHDDVLGLLVNGERWVPKAETPIEVVQPGRLRNPWTGSLLEGKRLGTTG